jgi:hypothetical protein
LSKISKHRPKFTKDLKKKYTCFQKGCNEFEAEGVMCIPETFISVASEGSLYLETHLETKCTRNVLK